MHPVPEVQRLLQLLEDRSEHLVEWGLAYGLRRYPEARPRFAEAALALVEREPSFAHSALWALNRAKAWPQDAAFAQRLRALLPRLAQEDAHLALEALVQAAGKDALPDLLQCLGAGSARRVAGAEEFLAGLPGGVELLLNQVRQNPKLRAAIPSLPQLLLEQGWSPASVREALACLAVLLSGEETKRFQYSAVLRAFRGHDYDCSQPPHARDEEWAQAVARECQPLISLETAKLILRKLEKGKGSGAAEALRKATPESWLAAPQVPDEPQAALARGILQTLCRDADVRARLAHPHPDWLCGLWTAALARLAAQAASPAAEPSMAAWPQVLEALRWPRPNPRCEKEWIARAASLGKEAIPALSELLRHEKGYVADRAAGALAAMQDEEALRALVQFADPACVDKLFPRIHAALLARVDAQFLREALAKEDVPAALTLLARWMEGDPAGDVLVEAVLPFIEKLVFAEDDSGVFTKFVRFHPDPRLLPLVDLWRPGEYPLAQPAQVLLALYRPEDPRWAGVNSDVAALPKLRERLESQEVVSIHLRCRRCQAAYLYDLRTVLVIGDLLDRKELVPSDEYTLIDDVVTCKRCGAQDEYVWTKNSRQTFPLQVLALGLYARGGKPSGKPSAISIAQSHSSVGDGLTLREVVARLDERIAQSPDDPDLPVNRAIVLLKLRHIDEALAAYARVLARWPGHARALFERSAIHVRYGRWAQALEDQVAAARSLKPSDPRAASLEQELRRLIRQAAKGAGQEVPLEALEALDRVRQALAQEAPAQKSADFGSRRAFGSRGRIAGLPTVQDDAEESESDYDEEYGDADGEEDDEENAGGDRLQMDEMREAALRANPARRVQQALQQKIMAYGHRYEPKQDWDAAVSCWRGKPVSFEAYLAARMVRNADGKEDAELIQFLEYRIFDWRATPQSKTLTERFKDAEWARLTRAEQTQLLNWTERRRRGWFEAEAVDSARHEATLRDLTGNETLNVFDVSLCKLMKKGDMVLSSVFPCGDRLECGGAVTIVPRHLRRMLSAWLQREYAAWCACRPAGLPSGWGRFFCERLVEIERELQRLRELPPIVRLPTGEDLSPAHAVYEVLDHRAARAALERWPSLQYEGFDKGETVEGEGYVCLHSSGDAPLPFARPLPTPEEVEGRQVISMSQTPLDPGQDVGAALEGPQAVGGVRLGFRQMEVSAFSRERLEYLEAQVQARLADAVRHLNTVLQPSGYVERLWQEARARGGSARGPASDPRLDALGQALQAEHMRRWPDVPLPALQGKTPRQAAADTALRPELEALLRDFEAQARTGPHAEGVRAILREVRKELGMA